MKNVHLERSAEMEWEGEIVRGSGRVRATSGSFTVRATFPSLRGEPPATTTPEELLAASHAACYAIALRSVIARRGGTAGRVLVTATIAAEKGGGAIRITRSHLSGKVEALAGIDARTLAECALAAKEECTISSALRGNVEVTCEVVATTLHEVVQ